MSEGFEPQRDAVAECPSDVFVNSAQVFDSLTICVTNRVSKEKLTHAANVAAQWLDNNQDGFVDDQLVLSALKKNKATLVMSESGFDFGGDKIFDALEEEGRFGQDLYAIETDPIDGRDASPEELHHLIIGAGWADVYPEIFDDQSQKSKISQVWQEADRRGYYNYLDPTCDSSCKTMEFLYKATAAYLGSLPDLEGDEFIIKSRSGLRKKMSQIVRVFEANAYTYTKFVWPDGHYKYPENIRYTFKK